ncbi:MAG: PAS domain S-box protein, partial [bacterium]|nr:PAS domain S-box protein [bacterium]
MQVKEFPKILWLMYDPYPYQISKIKISILILSIIILSLIFLALQSYPDLFSISGELIYTLSFLKYSLVIALFLFSWKTYSLLFSREYLFLSGGIIAFLLIQIFFDFYIALAFKNTSLTLAQSLFLQISDFIFFLFLSLAAFYSGKILPPQKRKPHVYRNILFTFMASIICSLGGYFFLAFSAIQPELQTLTLNSMRLLNGILLIIIGITYSRLYLKSRHNIYFWFLMSTLFFSFAIIYSFPHHTAGDIWESSSIVLRLIGFGLLIWTPFLEHTRFMEAEIKLRKSLEKSLFQSEQDRKTYSSLVNTVDVGICTFDEKGKLVFVNERLAHLLGFQQAQLIERNVNELFDTINLEKFGLELEKWRTGVGSQFEIEMLTRKNQRIPVTISAVPVFDLREKFTGSRLVIFEISAWKDLERKLRDYSADLKKTVESRTAELEQRTEQLKQAKIYYETLISGMLDILLVIDKKGNCTFINNYGKKLLGYSADELKSSRLPDFFTDLDRLRKSYGDAMKVELRDYEADVKTKEGQRILCSWNVRYLFDHNNQNIGAMCVGRDITELKAMQQKLEKHSQNLEQLVDERTTELNVRLEQLSKILKIGEEMTLDIDIGTILTNICQAIKNMGWRVVILSLKNQKLTSTRIVAYAGIAKTRIRSFVNERNHLFQNAFNYLRDEFRISHSYLIRHAKSGIPIDKLESIPQGAWQPGEAVIIPIRIKEKILGFVTIFEPTDKQYPNEQHVQILEIFVHKAAVAIENRRLIEEKTARAREIAQSNKAKSEYFTRMSHELRTPLNSIITLTGVLLQKMPGELNAEQVKQIQIIKQNGENLLKLINNILDMSKIEAGRMEPNFSYFSLSQAIQANVEAIRPLCQRKNLKLVLKLDKKLPEYIFSDQEKISQVMTNILGNAIKFTERGKIVVAAKPMSRDKQILFSISDTGIGMDSDEISRIFQSYQQLDHPDRRRFEGTGLGLAIAKQMWTLLGGTISVESKKGKGTT